jgi:CHAT domain-containing protein
VAGAGFRGEPGQCDGGRLAPLYDRAFCEPRHRRSAPSRVVGDRPVAAAGSRRSQDGVLRVNDIYNLDMPVNLVVLSGCETAAGRGLDSEGVFSLARAFFYAGTTRVVASLWPVDDRATAAFMGEFYRALLIEHTTAAGAIRSAQRRLAGDSRWASPYYWAGFVLQGDWG